MYIDDLVRPEILSEIEQRLSYFEIDSVLESGTLEQMIETEWYSPFPQTQVSERPDKVASALLEGRVAIVVDNTPFVLLLPTTINCFFQSAEDYYQRWYVMSFVRILRYCAAFLSFAIPGFLYCVDHLSSIYDSDASNFFYCGCQGRGALSSFD